MSEQQEPAPPASPAEPKVTDTVSTTRHTVEIAGTAVDYEATVATYVLGDRQGKPKCTMGFVAYVRDGDEGPRPVTFVFNGGPGSSAVWLHLGLFGPRRIPVDDRKSGAAPPYELVDNEQSLLDVTDLVFIDPVSTGYSRAVEGEDPKSFHGVTEDAEWVAELIRLWVTRNQRWSSPKYLAGESYGTIRAGYVAKRLQERFGMDLNGIVLIASVLWFQTLSFVPGNDLSYVLALPSMAAAAHYHGRVSGAASLAALLDEVEEFALGPYASWLLRSHRADADERARVRDDLARYTGLSTAYLDAAELRVTVPRFTKELLRDRRRTIGRLDGRITGIDRDPLAAETEHDPTFSAVRGPYAAAVNHYLSEELGFQSDLVYEFYDQPSIWPWNFGEEGMNKFLDAAESLRTVMGRNADLRLFIASGLYDLAAPYLAAEWTVDHMQLDPALRANVVTHRYEAGHMMYVHEASLEALRNHIAAFVSP